MPINYVGTQDSSGDFELQDGSGNVLFNRADAVQNIRSRFTIAQVNAGATILAAIPGHKYRMVRCSAIAGGGDAAAAIGDGARRA